MSTQRVYAAVRGPCLVRAHVHPDGLVVYLNGVRIVAHDAHPNHPVSFARDGSVCFVEGRTTQRFCIDEPDQLHALPRGTTVIHPDGVHGMVRPVGDLAWCDAEGRELRGALGKIELASGCLVDTWPVAQVPFVGVRIPGSGPVPTQAPEPSILFESSELVLAGDPQEHWALVSSSRLVLGRGGEPLCDVGWTKAGFFPPAATFDLERGRVYVAGRPGIVAFDLTGIPRESWSGGDAHVTSPVLVDGDELLVVVVDPSSSPRPGRPRHHQILRFSAGGLRRLGLLAENAQRELSEGESCLLRDDSGSLYWIPLQDPVRVWPGPAAVVVPGEQVEVVGRECSARFPPGPGEDPTGIELEHPEGGTAVQRLALARHLLESMQEDRRFEHLVQSSLDAFTPWREQLMALDDEALLRLRDMDRWRFYWVTRGAADAAVDALADRLAAVASGPLEGATQARALMLAGAMTDRALSRLGQLGRTWPQLRILLWNHHLELDEAGDTRLRFDPRVRMLLPTQGEPSPGLELGRRLHATTEECQKPVQHVITLRLDEVDGLEALAGSPLREQHFFLANCEECDAALEMDEWCFRSQGIDCVEPGEDACEGDGLEAAEPRRLELAGYDSRRLDARGMIGGRARWMQHPMVPACPSCESMMFFVGQVVADAVRADMPSAGLWGFHCERCGIGTQIVQMT